MIRLCQLIPDPPPHLENQDSFQWYLLMKLVLPNPYQLIPRVQDLRGQHKVQPPIPLALSRGLIFLRYLFLMDHFWSYCSRSNPFFTFQYRILITSNCIIGLILHELRCKIWLKVALTLISEKSSIKTL